MEQPLDMGLLKSGMLFRNMTDGELLDVLEATHARRQVFPSKARGGAGRRLAERGRHPALRRLHLSHVDASGNSNLMDALGPGTPSACSMPSAATGCTFPPLPRRKPSFFF